MHVWLSLIRLHFCHIITDSFSCAASADTMSWLRAIFNNRLMLKKKKELQLGRAKGMTNDKYTCFKTIKLVKSSLSLRVGQSGGLH